MNCDTTNPISSNQVVEVGLLKPRCATFKGNTLNDWLDWISTSMCEIDWSEFDLSKLTSDTILCQTQKVVIQKLIDEIANIKGEAESTKTISVNAGWSSVRQVTLKKKGNLIFLSGLITGGPVTDSICTLPIEYRPASDLIFCVANNFTPSASYNVFLKIKTDGNVVLYITGSGYVTTSPNIYLDGISYFLN